MSGDVSEVTERLENVDSPTLPSLYLRHSSISNSSAASPTSQFILQPFFRFSYVTGSSLTTPGEPPMVYMVWMINKGRASIIFFFFEIELTLNFPRWMFITRNVSFIVILWSQYKDSRQFLFISHNLAKIDLSPFVMNQLTWWPNDNRGRMSPKFPHICLRVEGKLRGKNLNHVIEPTGDRSRARCCP